MAKYKKGKFIKRDNSKNVLRVFNYSKSEQTVFSDFSMKTCIDMIDNDPVARGALSAFTSKFMEADYSIINKESLSYDKKFESLLNSKYMFRTKIWAKIGLMGKLFQNVFIEIVKDSKGVKDLNVLDSTTVKPITKGNGDPEKYKSVSYDADKRKTIIEWDAKDIVWLKFGDRTEGFAPINYKALYQNLLAKEYVTRFVAWLWKTGQYRLLYNPKSASDGDIEDFLTYSRKHDDNFKAPFIMKGELETKILRDIKETEEIERLLKYYDSQTLILMRVPPIDAGIPDASGRSNADAQTNSFSSEIKYFQKLAEDYINYDLFPKINKGNSLLRVGPTDRFAEEQVLKNIQVMKSFGASDEWCKEYINDRGMYFGAKEMFVPEPDLTQATISNPRDKDSAPSREGKTAGTSNKKIGTGKQSTTREDQL